jgi:hypothetical protein
MDCQFGIYASPADKVDQWTTLIYLQGDQPPRDLLREISPFLREFHAHQGMEDTESLAAWLTWYLIDSSAFSADELPRIAISRAIRSDIDYFYRLSPGMVEVYTIDELFDWKRIAVAEIPQEPVELDIS